MIFITNVPMLPSRTALLNGSNGKTTFISMRIFGLPWLISFLAILSILPREKPKVELWFHAGQTA
jgi:hypothetical protein